MTAHTDEYGVAVADAGVRQIYANRQAQAALLAQAKRAAQQYNEEAYAGFYKLQGNGLINLVNDATKLVDAPAIPKFEVSGEYWQDKQQVAETATTMTAGVLTGGASVAGDALVIASSAGNMTEAATGEDLRTGEQLSTTDRVLRGTTGVAGAYSVRGRVDDITQGVSSQVKNIKPPTSVAEAVTPEGVRVPVSSADDALTATAMEARSSKQLSGARGAKFEEQALAKAKAAHPDGFKPDAEAQRLGYTNQKAADWVGLERTKNGNYVAHVTEITVEHKSLSELGKQLDGAQKLAMAKLGDKIDDYRYYIRTNSKELVDALAKEGNKIKKPGSDSKFKVTVIFEEGGK